MPDIFDLYTIPLSDWIETGINWVVSNYRWVFQGIKWPVDKVLNGITDIFLFIPPIIFLILLFLIAWRVANWRIALFSVASLTFLGFLGVWEDSMITIAMVVSAVIFCAVVGIPLGILAARSNHAEAAIRPILDVMQTTPSFVYLVPVVMLIGIGSVAGVIATIIFSMPPIVRLTNLGIRQVQADVVEAAYAFGATPTQVLREIQVPLALRTIMAGMNQTLMLALSMVVIASLIGGGGLGTLVRQGLNNLQPGIGFLGGIGIVLIAIVLDRITQALGQGSNPSTPKRWTIAGLFARFRGTNRNGEQQASSVSNESDEQGEGRKEKVSVSSD